MPSTILSSKDSIVNKIDKLPAKGLIVCRLRKKKNM